MKKSVLIAAIMGLVLLSSCGGDDCFRCRKDSYFNGINYTDPGPWGINCRHDGESEENFKARIQEKISQGYTCQEK